MNQDETLQDRHLGMPQRIIQDGTKINLKFGDVLIPAMLNQTETAKALLEKLPLTISVGGTPGIDFCGRMPFSLPYKEDQVHHGWLNGDIDYNPGGGWFAVLYGGQDESDGYSDQVTIGALTCRLEEIEQLQGSYDLAVERAE